MKTLTLGKLLHLPAVHQLASIPIEQATAKQTDYLIVYGQQSPLFVDLENANGFTDEARFASRFTKEELLIGLGLVPFADLPTCFVLEVASNKTKRGIATTDLLATHGHLPLFKEMAERYRARERATIYDPYRYSYTIDERKIDKETHLQLVPRKEYERIRDFHPFLQTKRGNVYAVPCVYHDPKQQREVKIYIMGWYFYEQHLKLSWKPSHSRKSRWRSSIIFLDKRTEQPFFQGELYKKGSFPIFLDHLQPAPNKGNSLANTYQNFLSIIDKQKRQAQLR